MTHYCLDACSIINLFCGWGGIQELHSFGSSWSTSATALNEFKEVRIQEANGTITRSPLDTQALLEQYPLLIYSELTLDEFATAIALVEEIDDGEAECIAIALHRSLVFVSDDTLAIAAAANLHVPAVSSLDLISQWAEVDSPRIANLPEILRRIETLARYVPPRTHGRRSWWDGIRGSGR